MFTANVTTREILIVLSELPFLVELQTMAFMVPLTDSLSRSTAQAWDVTPHRLHVRDSLLEI